MIGTGSLLVKLVELIDQIPTPPVQTGRGRPRFYPDRVVLKGLVIMILKRVHTVYGLLQLLDQPSAEMQVIKGLLTHQGRFPSRRTWERRLQQIPDQLPAQISCFGYLLLSLLDPFAHCGRAAAIDSSVLRAKGGVWHKKDRQQGIVPHSSIDTQAHWTKSGWHGWVYGWKLHIVVTASWVWLPLAARLTAANEADNEVAQQLLPEIPESVRYLLGDCHYDAPNVHAAWETGDRFVIASTGGPYPKDDPGREVRRLFHKLRSVTIENFNEQFKAIFEGHGQVPTKGLSNTKRFVLGAVLVYQLTLLLRFQMGLDLRVGLKPFLKAA